MKETYYIGAYWGHNLNESSESADSLLKMLNCLAEIDPLFQRWFLASEDYETSRQTISIDRESLIKLIQPKSGNYSSIALWNHLPKDISIKVGLTLSLGYSESSLVIDLPIPVTHSYGETFVVYSKMLRSFKCIVNNLNPKAAIVTSRLLRDVIYDKFPLNPPLIGWMSLVDIDINTIKSLENGSEYIPILNNRAIVVITEERFTVTNVGHLVKMEKLIQLLDKYNLLPRLN